MSNPAVRKMNFSLILFIPLIVFCACAGGPERAESGDGSALLEVEERVRVPVQDEAGSIAAEIEWRILTWPQGKRAAVSLTFDDGTLDQYEVALPLMERHGVRATYFLITGLRGTGVWRDGRRSRQLFDWEAAKEIAARGHEIGSHGVSHRDLRRLFWREELNEIEQELQCSYMEIKKHIPPEYLPAGGVLSFSWPYWRSTPELERLAEKYYLAARSGKGRLPLRFPSEPYSINSVRVMSSDSPEKWRQKLNSVRKTGGWALFSLHGVDGGHMDKSELGWQPVSEEKFTQLIRMAKAEDLWAAPFGEVFRYCSERITARLEIDLLRRGCIALRLEDGLDDEVFNQALTVELTFPERVWSGFSGVVVESSGDQGDSRVLDMKRTVRGQTVRLDLVPNGEPVVLRGAVSTAQIYNQ